MTAVHRLRAGSQPLVWTTGRATAKGGKGLCRVKRSRLQNPAVSLWAQSMEAEELEFVRGVGSLCANNSQRWLLIHSRELALSDA